MGRDEGKEEEEGETFRRVEKGGFGREMEEEVAAAMLRVAKERFRSRRLDEVAEKAVASLEHGSMEESDIELPVIKGEPQSGVEEDDEDKEGEEGAEMETTKSDAPRKARRQQRVESPGLVPVVSADDELSYELLRPLARHILTQLDNTLTVLHNARVAGIDYRSGSQEEEVVEEATKPKTLTRRPKRKFGLSDDDTDSAVPPRPSSRKIELHTPENGETEREMRVRLARKYHRRIPRFSDEEGEATAAGRSTPKKNLKVTTPAMAKTPPRQPDSDIHRGRRLNDWALRDWSDVLGAAAMAGFPPNVIARATQRCADLFGQGMQFNTLAEEPATGRGRKSRTTRYVPGESAPPTSDEEDEEEEGYRSEAEQIRAVSRASSVILDGSSSDEAAQSATSRGSRRSSRRSYSTGPSVVRLYCPHASCSGAINGFARRFNLRKHLAVVHGKNPEAVSDDDQDDLDEVHGAVHVDGFLKPIRPRKGWRGRDAQPSVGRRQKRRRRGTPPPRQFYSDDGYHAELNDDDLIKAEDDADYV